MPALSRTWRQTTSFDLARAFVEERNKKSKLTNKSVEESAQRCSGERL